jgi:hypothetical protein
MLAQHPRHQARHLLAHLCRQTLPIRGAAPGALRETDRIEWRGEDGSGVASASPSVGKARCPDSTPARASPPACPTATIRAFNSCKEVQSTCASLDNRTLQQAARSNIQPGTSMHRALRSGVEPHRNIRSPPLTITSCTKTRSPNHGCQGYRSSKQSVTWALRRRVLQHGPAPLLARLPDTRGLRRQSHRNTRSAAQPRPAPPLACCSHRAARRINRRGPNRRWMNPSAAGQRAMRPFPSQDEYSKSADR